MKKIVSLFLSGLLLSQPIFLIGNPLNSRTNTKKSSVLSKQQRNTVKPGKIQIPIDVLAHGWFLSELRQALSVTQKGIQSQNKEAAMVWAKMLPQLQILYCLDIWMKTNETSKQKTQLLKQLESKIQAYTQLYVLAGKNTKNKKNYGAIIDKLNRVAADLTNFITANTLLDHQKKAYIAQLKQESIKKQIIDYNRKIKNRQVNKAQGPNALLSAAAVGGLGYGVYKGMQTGFFTRFADSASNALKKIFGTKISNRTAASKYISQKKVPDNVSDSKISQGFVASKQPDQQRNQIVEKKRASSPKVNAIAPKTEVNQSHDTLAAVGSIGQTALIGLEVGQVIAAANGKHLPWYINPLSKIAALASLGNDLLTYRGVAESALMFAPQMGLLGTCAGVLRQACNIYDLHALARTGFTVGSVLIGLPKIFSLFEYATTVLFGKPNQDQNEENNKIQGEEEIK